MSFRSMIFYYCTLPTEPSAHRKIRKNETCFNVPAKFIITEWNNSKNHNKTCTFWFFLRITLFLFEIPQLSSYKHFVKISFNLLPHGALGKESYNNKLLLMSLKMV